MPLIAAQCSDATKLRFRALAERHGMSESALLRQMISQVLAGNEKPTDLERLGGGRGGRGGQLRLRLRPKEITAIRALAEPAGQSAQGWVVAQLRHRLENAILCQGRNDRVACCVREISAVARNLNTITHRLLRSGQYDDSNLDLQALTKGVERVRREMIAVTTRANHRSGARE